MPDTNNYLMLGLVVVFGLLGLYLLSLVLRFSNAKKDIELLQDLSKN